MTEHDSRALIRVKHVQRKPDRRLADANRCQKFRDHDRMVRDHNHMARDQGHVSVSSKRWEEIYDIFLPLYMAHDTAKVVDLLAKRYDFRTTKSICDRKIQQWRAEHRLLPKYQITRLLEQPVAIRDLTAPVLLGSWTRGLAISESTNTPDLLEGADEFFEGRILTLLWLVEAMLDETCGDHFADHFSFDLLLKLTPKNRASSTRNYVQNIRRPSRPVDRSQLSTVVFDAQRWQEKLVFYTVQYIRVLNPTPEAESNIPEKLERGRELTQFTSEDPMNWDADDVDDLAYTICRRMPDLLGLKKPSWHVFEKIKKMVGERIQVPPFRAQNEYDQNINKVVVKLGELKLTLWDQVEAILASRSADQPVSISKMKWTLRITLQLVGIYGYDLKAKNSRTLLQTICQKIVLGCQQLGLIVLEGIREKANKERERKDPIFCCCQCGDGPTTRVLHPRCISCEHEICDNCE